MPVNKVRRLGSFAPLSAHAYKDDALAEAGEAAELLYYRALSFAADVLRDGLVTDSQLIRLVGHGMRDTKRRADRLVSVGLWTREEGGYRIKSWLKWNRSLAEITRLQRKDADRKAGGEDVPNGLPPQDEAPSGRTPNGIQPDSDSDIEVLGLGILRPHTEPTPEPHTEPESSPRSARKRAARQLPEAWQPTDNHRAYSSEHNIDLIHEAEQFRQHAQANDRRQVDWDAAFRTWLGNRKEWARPKSQQQSLSRFVEQ